ncbi:SPI-7-type island replicative DNA helicase [Pectobacterium brasiliense]|uniref:Replicative DNA helicase n=1 Tax=Pectobacterium brasiliense TaxID=180957 RepID=A0A3S0XS42_9GAMM|nr:MULTISPECIES: SPI-7-type island replicative DNA helicase [Pectobacterium]GKW29511.1 replicative DNA helicase [Pectobacterium carotovorum subsp. carotovorum]MBN3048140.1 replicative DNA helicase [Pectobacterium brasiliense]MBN3057114.1 replicative DNA helicase [Pectobacterium brasiliense]MBN3077573.1 replicative DNA helicase [Pectobacterium brasiliense]MBN3082071.1 replicative DNA helicase [Pectobacterium polaris]
MPNSQTQHLPFSLEAEQSVIGALMLENNRWDDVVERIVAGDFYNRAHQQIFKAMQRLVENGQPIDLITLSESIEKAPNNLFESIGGFAYLAELAKNTPSAANTNAYAEIVRDRSQARQLIALGKKISADAMSTAHGQIKVSDIAEQAEQALFNISEQRETKGEIALQHGLTLVVDRLERNNAVSDGITGTPTGYRELDKETCGLQDSDLIILAARPSMGKTSLGLNFSENAFGLVSDKPIFIFSLEMPAEQLLMRMTASIAKVSVQAMRSGQLDDEAWARISDALGIMKSWENRLIIDDNSDLTPSLLRSRLRRFIRKYGKPCLVMIDYLQLMSSPGSENRTQEISVISRSLKAIAKYFDVPLVALSQLNRASQTRADKRPTLSDLRDGGSLEQDADMIIFIHREEVYDSNTSDKGLAEIIIGKQRQGPVGTVKLAFDAQYTRFRDLSSGYGEKY